MLPTNVDENKVALSGYDAVSYFAGEPAKGLDDLTSTHEGSLYRFATPANLETFKSDPGKYAPQYGGWCATAVSENKTFWVDPLNYIVEDDKLFVFYKGEAGDTKPEWEADPVNRRTNADANWASGKVELHHLEAANQ